ncbi:CocE/NonD family hydrolase [Ruminococcaceae bacterium OttesenSCG-928-D13]|nr:CocE/NonD family hydrolase [Ruminococcaceae bacterium OttesenSCG-928-D13]
MAEKQKITRKVNLSGVPGGAETDVRMIEMMRPATFEQLEAMSAEEQETHRFLSPFNPHTYIAEEGILCEQDVGVRMRDGVTIYADIYRPEKTDAPVPVIISWSFYGKRQSEGRGEWAIMGVPPNTVSNMAKYESPDPGYWCRHGYAVANVDPRGIGYSEGEFIQFSSQDGRDGYDFIEWIAAQAWCNGRVGMAGNSCVAMSQYRIAAQQPPHLCAIAPWEGTSDMYRESLYEGGIPAVKFVGMVLAEAVGEGFIDDAALNAEIHPFADDPYWRDKEIDFSKITQPAYLTACWNHFHLRGSFQAFRKIKSNKKWMRAHREFEWPDAYTPKYLQELELFFDRYLKLERNGWELTPKVRIEVQDAFDCDYQINRVEENFPLKRTKYQKLYLDAANRSMAAAPLAGESSVSYDPETEEVCFDYTFTEETELTGYMSLRLWVEADGHDDMDMFVNVQKLSTTGEWLPVHVLKEPHPGAWGKMRVSRRKLDEKLSTSFQPVQAHLVDEKLKPGEIVPVDIEIVPHSRIWHKGQKIRVQVAGRYIREDWFEPLVWDTDNKGRHVIHTGGKYDSWLQIPVIPPKYADGDYVYR